MSPLAIIIEFEPIAEHREEFLNKLRQDAAETLNDDGCMRMEVLLARDGSGRIVLSELWRDQAALDAHRAKPGHSHAWQEPLLHTKRTIRYDLVSGV
jgi:quinol monooxygenase YgiN